jgi:hypothetical protein
MFELRFAFSFTHAYVVQKAEVLERIRLVLDEFYPNPAICPDVSRIINKRHTKRIAALVCSSVDTYFYGLTSFYFLLSLLDDPSIRIIAGGQVNIEKKYIAPTVVEATLDSLCMRDEIFGPILPVVEFPSVRLL